MIASSAVFFAVLFTGIKTEYFNESFCLFLFDIEGSVSTGITFD